MVRFQKTLSVEQKHLTYICTSGKRHGCIDHVQPADEMERLVLQYRGPVGAQARSSMKVGSSHRSRTGVRALRSADSANPQIRALQRAQRCERPVSQYAATAERLPSHVSGQGYEMMDVKEVEGPAEGTSVGLAELQPSYSWAFVVRHDLQHRDISRKYSSNGP